MNELALFAGAGGGILGGKLLGWRTVCAVEFNSYCQRVLLARQRDGFLPRFPIWDNVETFDGQPWRGHIDVVSGGFPCTDISSAGRGAGIEGKQSSLWKHMARIIGEVRPRYVFVENSPLLVRRGLAVVISDLAALGYDARWGIVGAHHVAAPHKRDRIWILADDTRIGRRTGGAGRSYPSDTRQPEQALQTVANRPVITRSGQRDNAASDPNRGQERIQAPVGGSGCSRLGGTAGNVAHADKPRLEECEESVQMQRGQGPAPDGAERPALQQEWIDRCRAQWASDAGILRVAYGIPHRVDRIRAIGNAQVPAVAALAWRLLGGPMT